MHHKMKSYESVVVALACVIGISADQQCLTSLAKYPFDAAQFSGTWYVVARTKEPHDEHKDLTCVKINHDDDGSHVHIQVSFKTSDGSERIMEGNGEATGASSTMTWKSSDGHEIEDNVHFSILATDYKTYAMSHACRDSASKVRHDSIWSREPTLDPVVLKTLQSVMSGLDIPDDDWDLVNNSGC